MYRIIVTTPNTLMNFASFYRSTKMNNVNIAEKLLAVRLNCSFCFGRVTDKQITNETNQTKNTRSLIVRKGLFPVESGKKLRELTGVLSAFYGYHKKVTMSGVNEGERLLPVVFYLDYMQEYGTYQVLVQEAYDAFESDYPHAITKATSELGAAYNPADYPPVTELRDLLRFKVQTLPLPAPATGSLLDAVGVSLQADVDSFLGGAVKETLKDVNTRIKDALQRMVKQLSDPKGKVYDSLTENLVELISYIPSFNVTGDDSLSLLAEEIKTRLLTVGPNDLRHDPIKRQETAGAAYEILRRMGV